MAALRVLSIAVASGRVGYVCLQGRQLLDWGITIKATESTGNIVAFTQELIATLKPDVLVTEKCGPKCRKGTRTRELIQAIAELASHNELLDVSVERTQRFSSKYEEADELLSRHPDLEGYRPKKKRRIFEFEPRGMILFEALAMAEKVTKGPPEILAAAMG